MDWSGRPCDPLNIRYENFFGRPHHNHTLRWKDVKFFFRKEEGASTSSPRMTPFVELTLLNGAIVVVASWPSLPLDCDAAGIILQLALDSGIIAGIINGTDLQQKMQEALQGNSNVQWIQVEVDPVKQLWPVWGHHGGYEATYRAVTLQDSYRDGKAVNGDGRWNPPSGCRPTLDDLNATSPSSITARIRKDSSMDNDYNTTLDNRPGPSSAKRRRYQ